MLSNYTLRRIFIVFNQINIYLIFLIKITGPNFKMQRKHLKDNVVKTTTHLKIFIKWYTKNIKNAI